MTEREKKEALRYLGYKGAEADETTLSKLEAAFAELEDVANPLYLCRVEECQVMGDTVILGQERIHSQALANCIQGSVRAALFAMTLGPGPDWAIRRSSGSGDLAQAAILSAAANVKAEECCDRICASLRDEYAGQGLVTTPRFSPGFGDFTLENQELFFRLLPCEKQLRMELTKDNLINPVKSVTAIVGLRPARRSEAESPKSTRLDRLGKELLFFDGAMGTQLQAAGLRDGELPELWNLTHPDDVRAIHQAYRAAGCDVMTANTFGANHLKLERSGHTVEDVVTAGVRLAKEAANGALVALDVGPLGKLLKPFGTLDFDEAVSLFREPIRAGAAAGADFVLMETVSDIYEAKAVILAAREVCTLPIVALLTFDERHKLLTGGDVAAAAAMLEGLGVTALGFNCGLGPAQMKDLLPELLAVSSLPVVCIPNAGMPLLRDGETIFPVGPAEFARDVRALAELGACAVGGCCGTTPDHLRAVRAACEGLRPLPVVQKHRTVVSSWQQAVVFGERPLVIGERINPTGKKRLKQALREDDMEYLLREALAQAERGADILDVNVGLPEIDEPAVMARAVAEIQAVTGLPLQIDTADTVAMERALRLYNGKPLLNSVNGKKESLDAVLPLVKKYGAAVVCLTLDEDGIPETADGRIAVAEKILARALREGIPREDLIFDPLTITISTGGENARITLEALRRLRAMGLHTVLGVSNVSFGLPRREQLNSVFFASALENGLSAGIINPLSDAMMQTLDSFCALSGCDTGCARYIARYADAPAAPSSPAVSGEALSLTDAVIRGLSRSAEQAARVLLETTPPLTIVTEHLVPALDQVGKGFENGTLFLPQLLMSADATKAAFAVVQAALQRSGAQNDRGTIVIATVRGDIHDIGKNIVKTLLENYGFTVIDLGKDVPPEKIVAAVREHNAPLVGLSALMTTTVVHMAETVRLLRQEVPECKIMVGGAVLTQEYADDMGADFYGSDAMASVRYAEQIFSE